MKLSLSGRILQGGPSMETPDFVRLARETGFDLVELRPVQVPIGSTDEQLAALRRVLDAEGIGVSMIVMDQLSHLDGWVRVAQALGAVLLRGGGSVEQLAAAAQALPEGLRLVTQMHSGSPFEDVAQARASLAAIPSRRFGLMPEPANLLFAGHIWSEELFEPLRGRLYGCNAQSIALSESSDTEVVMNDGRRIPYARVAWGENEALDFPGFLRALQAVGYDEFVNFIDPFDPKRDVRGLASATAAYARRCLDG